MDYEIIGTLNGEFWWPIGFSWEKPLKYRFAFGRERFFALSAPVHETLREALDQAVNDGDSSSACRVSEGVLKVTRKTATGYRVRFFDLSLFSSVSDYLSA